MIHSSKAYFMRGLRVQTNGFINNVLTLCDTQVFLAVWIHAFYSIDFPNTKTYWFYVGYVSEILGAILSHNNDQWWTAQSEFM